ncbi:hypothetical protein GMLC_16730 [Geomonas limicola]|uniref:Uncharacterized protein n=1 Tax=Geomonas limicola TaxID=2740186 RepID=A0A6V8N825_9BACT|nr:hypothetical protein [Geomonas limicola]GFO68094.1 hypothetical protein GMLC_16730 [Geomonas limicola]
MNEETVYSQQFIQSLMENMAWGLIQLATDDEGNQQIMTRKADDLMYLRIINSKREVVFQVSGENIDALGSQMVLACLHKISIEKLRQLHKTPLRRPLQAV